MKALVYTDVEQLAYGDVPDPRPRDEEVLVKVMASGICGSDMHAFLGHDERRPAPLILGHEAAGLVASGVDTGRRVTVNPLVTCGVCDVCCDGRTNLCATRQIISMQPREGAFAEYISMPTRNLITVPDHVPLAKAALAEPLACGWHGVRLAEEALSTPMAAARCIVIGGGAIGVGAALALRAFGASDVTLIEPNEIRRAHLNPLVEFACAAPGDPAIPAKGSADIVIDAVGYAVTRADACAYARAGGAIVHIGLGEATGGLDIRRLTLQEIRFIGTYTYTATDFEATAAAIFSGALGTLDWIEQRPLADGQAAFADIRGGRVAAAKTILIPAHEE
ncbi:MAG: alcohol dehydrogenase catalytic domain-containing protein [Pseudomonadota bacterium]